MIKVNTQALEQIKSQIFALKGNSVELCVNRGRKKFDTFVGVIDNAYPSVFTILANEKLQTFSYFDVLCGNVVLKNKK